MKCSFIIKLVLDFERNSKAWKVDNEASLESLGTRDQVLLQFSFWYSSLLMDKWNYSINQISYASYRFQVFHNIVMLPLQVNWDNTSTNEIRLFIAQQFWRKIVQTDQVHARNLKFMAIPSSELVSPPANLDLLSALAHFSPHLKEELGLISLYYYCFFSCFYILRRIPLVMKTFHETITLSCRLNQPRHKSCLAFLVLWLSYFFD